MGPKVIVVDTNVVTYLVVEGSDTASAERLRSSDGVWHVPSLFRHEWLNVVSRYLQGGDFSRDEAAKVYRRGVALVRVEESPPDPITVLNLVRQSGCTSYDCQFIALAEHLRVRLVTVDKELLAAFPASTLQLRNF